MPHIPSTNPPFKRNKVLITYKKVEENHLQTANKLVKSGYNYIILEEDQIFELKGVTSLDIDNIGETNVMVNGILLLAFNDNDTYTNGVNELQKIVKRNSKTFVHGDGTFSDVSLDINFIYEEIQMVAGNNSSGLPVGAENIQEVFAGLNASGTGIGLENFVVYEAFNSSNNLGSGSSGSSGGGVGLGNFVTVFWTAYFYQSGAVIGSQNFESSPFNAIVGLNSYWQTQTLQSFKAQLEINSDATCSAIGQYGSSSNLAVLTSLYNPVNSSDLTVRNSLTSFNANSQGYLKFLNLNSNVLESINIDSIGGLDQLRISENRLESLNLTNSQSLTTVRVILADNNWLTSVNLTGATNLNALDLRYNNLSSSEINSILAQLVLIGYQGAAQLYGGTNQAPTGQGLIDKDYLISQGAIIITTT